MKKIREIKDNAVSFIKRNARDVGIATAGIAVGAGTALLAVKVSRVRKEKIAEDIFNEMMNGSDYDFSNEIDNAISNFDMDGLVSELNDKFDKALEAEQELSRLEDIADKVRLYEEHGDEINELIARQSKLPLVRRMNEIECEMDENDYSEFVRFDVINKGYLNSVEMLRSYTEDLEGINEIIEAGGSLEDELIDTILYVKEYEKNPKRITKIIRSYYSRKNREEDENEKGN